MCTTTGRCHLRHMLVYLGLLGSLTLSRSQDPCQSEILVIRDAQYRDVNYSPTEYEWEYVSDYNTIVTDAWYRMSTDDNRKLADQCPAIGACGTLYPIWTNGQHPTDDVIHTMQVFLHLSDSCTYWSGSISVKRCLGDSGRYFYIYQLTNPPFSQTAYCSQTFVNIPPTTTSTTPITPSTTSTTTSTSTPTSTTTTTTTATTTTRPSCNGVWDPTNRQNCLPTHPQLSGNPVIDGPYLEDDQPAIYCRISYTGSDVMNRERFYVTFVIGRETLAEIEADSSQLRVKLPPEELIGRIGNAVSCRVTSAWSFSSSVRSPLMTSSNDYFLGIQVSDNRIDIGENSDQPTLIWPYATLPVTCPTPRERCSLGLSLLPDEDDVKFGFVCEYHIYKRNWNQTSRTATGVRPLILKAKQSPLYSNPETTFRLQFSSLALETNHIWNGYVMDPITIHYTDRPYGLCKVQLDTDVTTFDKRQYSFPGNGEFLVLKTSTKSVYEVQIRTKLSAKCYGGRVCVCGVAVRYADDVIVLDTCSDYITNGVRFDRAVIYKYNSELSTGMKVTRDGPGRRFSFNLPSGAHTIAEVRPYGLDLYVYTTGEYYGKTAGLCGSYDGDPDNDPEPMTTNSVDWLRIQRSTSLFDKKPDASDPDEPPLTFCSCVDTKTVSCGPDQIVDPASYSGAPGVKDVGPPGSEVDPPKRKTSSGGSPGDPEDPEKAFSEADNYLEWSYRFDYTQSPVAPSIPSDSWPTVSGITETEARTQCQTAVRQLPFYSTCTNTVGTAVEQLISQCMRAIQRLDTKDVATWAVSGFEQECVFDSSTQDRLRTKTADGGYGLPDQSLFRDMCPDNCNGRGVCVRQKCVCSSGYSGADCSLPADQPPTAQALIGGESCDVRARPCRRVGVMASNISDEGTLTCRITFLNTNGQRGTSYETRATLRTWTEVVCELPDSPLTGSQDSRDDVINSRHYWLIELTNDGVHYSGGLTLFLWDSKCLLCTDDSHCVVRTDSCLINGKCYARYESNPLMSSCSRCDPDVSTSQFTPILNNRQPSLSGPFELYKLRYDVFNKYLTAADPESQSAVAFSLDVPLSVSGISLSSRGLLHVSDEVFRNVSLSVKASDPCGASDTQIFRILTLDCGCEAQTSCADQVSRSRTHDYLCYCYDGSCSPAWIESCLRPVCPAGALCRPAVYLSGYSCRCLSDVLESRCRLDGGPADWSSWSRWSDCSKPCDYGIRRRQRTCLGCPSPEVTSELCHTVQCEELTEEKYKGVIVIAEVNNKDKIEDVLLKQNDFLGIIRQWINDLCVEQSSKCCGREVWLNPSYSYTFVPGSNIWLASGYPQVDWMHGKIKLKVLATIPGYSYQQNCLKSARRKRAAPSDTHYVPPEVIKEAVTESIVLLEEGLDVRIVDVREVEDVDNTLLYASVAGVIGFFVLVSVILVVCLKRRRNKTKKKKAAAEKKRQHRPEPQRRGRTQLPPNPRNRPTPHRREPPQGGDQRTTLPDLPPNPPRSNYLSLISYPSGSSDSDTVDSYTRLRLHRHEDRVVNPNYLDWIQERNQQNVPHLYESIRSQDMSVS